MGRFTDQKPRKATEEDLRAPWGGDPKNFRCYLCGYRFKLGNYWRWVYSDGRTFVDNNRKKLGVTNLITCKKCDGEDILERWVEKNREFYTDPKWWYFRS